MAYLLVHPRKEEIVEHCPRHHGEPNRTADETRRDFARLGDGQFTVIAESSRNPATAMEAHHPLFPSAQFTHSSTRTQYLTIQPHVTRPLPLLPISQRIDSLALLSPPTVATRAAGGRPNVVFILADDLGWSDTTLYRTTKSYQTPHLERLAKRGMLFTHAYSASSAVLAHVVESFDRAASGPHGHLQTRLASAPSGAESDTGREGCAGQ